MGTLTFQHHSKSFSELDESDCEELAEVSRRILQYFELNCGIHNTLIYSRESFGSFGAPKSLCTVHFIPYPNCNNREKLKVALDIIFGSSALSERKQTEICNAFHAFQALDSPQEQQDFQPSVNSGNDPFCNDEILDRQRIADFEDSNCDILQDNRPKVDGEHVLIVPKRERGHVDHSRSVPTQTRAGVFTLASRIMKVFANSPGKFDSLIYLERNGQKLRGVQHMHGHVKATQWPQTLGEKIRALFRLAWSPELSATEMKNRIERFHDINHITINDSNSKL